MSANGKQEQYRLGFLTAIEVPEKGYVGGLLVTNHFGRPLEFQCTLPVKPNATQEMLYGPTLAPFLLGELIGQTLVEKAGVKPQLILTDREQILELRNHLAAPVAFVSAKDDAKTEAPAMKLGRQKIYFHAAHTDDEQTVTRDAKQVPGDADLCEPFERVREALQETIRLGALR